MSRAAARHEKRSRKTKDHGPLLQLVQQEITRAPVRASRAPLKPLTERQRLYGAAIGASRVIFGIGPAGTGKTWYAAALAAEALLAGDIERIIITRPAVEAAEERLGFLPGEMDEKVEPYFRPVRDALEERLGSGQLEYLVKTKIIEVRPLAFLRGATFKNAMVLADEMQNSTVSSMKMLLTRMGEGSTMVVNGDPDQCDLPDPSKSGLLDAIRRLKHIKCVTAVHFEPEDIVRDSIVQEIVEAYMSKPVRSE